MLGFVQNWFAQPTSTIGVDFGSDSVRAAQVERIDGEFQLLAAGRVDVPSVARNDVGARIKFYAEALREILGQSPFQGRRAVLSLPASLMHVQHLRMPKLDDEALKKALPWELRGKLPFDPSQAALRHLIAGEIYQDQEPKNEVIVMAARRDWVDQLLAAASKARLDVAGMNVEPKAIVDCFSHVYRRKSDAEAVTCYVDIGSNATRAVIALGGEIRFARIIPVGGEHFNRAVANDLKIPLEEARVLRVRAASQVEETPEKAAVPSELERPAERASIDNEFALLGNALSAAKKQQTLSEPGGTAAATATPPVSDQKQQFETACREPIMKIVEELALCRRYYEAAFTNQPLERLIFVGGEARQRGICQTIARELGIAAQIGDPMARMARTTTVGIESGIDRRQPQPAWAVAIGLSMGPVGAVKAASK